MKKLIVLAVIVAGCAGQPGGASDLPPRVETQELGVFLARQGYSHVPMMRLATGHFSIEGTAGSIPFDLIIDTGASHTLIDEQRAERFELLSEDRGGRATGVGGTMQQRVGTGRLDDVAIGPVRFESIQVRVLDLSHINGVLRNLGSKPVDGIIGADVLTAQQAVIDYGTLSLYIKE
jgi:hypothetical protein